MRLVHILTVVLTELSIGSLLVTAFVSPRAMPEPFYAVNSLLGALLAAVALVFVKIALPGAFMVTRYLGLAVIGATVAYGLFRIEWRSAARLFLMLSGLTGLLFGLLPLAERMLPVSGIATTVPHLFVASALAGALLLGSAYVTMFFSQWYGFVRGSYYEHLERLLKVTLAAISVRLLLLLVAVFSLSRLDPALAHWYLPSLYLDQLFLFAGRIAFGLLAPLVLVLKALWLVQARTDPPPVGRLAVLMGCVAVGELLAAHLLL